MQNRNNGCCLMGYHSPKQLSFLCHWACILTFIFVLLATASACAEDIYSSGFFHYTEEDGAVAIVDYFGNEETVDVPSSIIGLPVSRICSGAFTAVHWVKTINLPDTIMYVEQGAFKEGQIVHYDESVTGQYSNQTGAAGTTGQQDGNANKETGGTNTSSEQVSVDDVQAVVTDTDIVEPAKVQNSGESHNNPVDDSSNKGNGRQDNQKPVSKGNQKKTSEDKQQTASKGSAGDSSKAGNKDLDYGLSSTETGQPETQKKVNVAEEKEAITERLTEAVSKDAVESKELVSERATEAVATEKITEAVEKETQEPEKQLTEKDETENEKGIEAGETEVNNSSAFPVWYMLFGILAGLIIVLVLRNVRRKR